MVEEQSIIKDTQDIKEVEIGISDETISAVENLLHDEDFPTLNDLLDGLNPSDYARLLQTISDNDTITLIEHLGDKLPADTIAYLNRDTSELVLKHLSPEHIGSIIADLDTDDAVELVEFFPEEDRKAILRHVSKKIRSLVEEGLTYPEDSAGRMMQREFVAAPKFWTVGKTLDYLRGLNDDLPEGFHDIFIIDPMYHVVGEVPLAQIMRSERSVKLGDIKRESLHLVPVTMDQEEVAHIFRRDTLISAPVVDENNRLLGVITLDDIVDVVDEEAEEDIFRLAGMGDSDINRGIWRTTRSRFTWLLLNLFTAILASIAIGFFEATLQQVVALAVLMPIVASMGGNAGTQTLTVAVRALATKELSTTNAMRITFKEVMVGVINGLAFAVIAGLVAYLWFHDPMIGGVIAIAMVANLIIAGLAGMMIPLTLNRFKIDPALASAVFLTTITDIIGFGVFLGLATLLLF